MKIALAFQREVINNVVPRVRPDLIHGNGYMTGQIPTMARQACITCLFTIHNIYSMKSLLAHIEESGIDSSYFWQHYYYERMGYDYEGTRETNPVGILGK